MVNRSGGLFMKNDYIYDTEKIYYKHEITEDLSENVYSMHIHNAYELIYFLSGDATYVIEDRKYKLKKGDLILIRPFKYHFIQIDSPASYERYDILFDPQRHGIESAALMDDKAEVISISDNTIADGIFKKFDTYYKKCDADTFSKLLSHLLSELFYSIHLFPHRQVDGTNSVSPLILKALSYINENLCGVDDIREIADRLYVSESYLFRKFKGELHKTPKKYILEKRLLLSREMIDAGKAPTEACFDSGFKDYTTFYRNFVAFFGHSPKQITK